MDKTLKKFPGYIAKLSKKAMFIVGFSVIGTSVSFGQSAFGSNYFGTPMFSTWDEADLAKSGTKGYFGGRLTLPEGADKWPEEFQEQLKQYKISHFASRETIHENEVPDEIKSFSYYELPTLSTESVKIQMKRVAREREITDEQLEELIKKHERKSQWAVFIDPWINIQELNRDLDQVYPFPIPEPKPVQAVKETSKKKTQIFIRKPRTTANATKVSKTSATSKTAKTTNTTAKTATSVKTAKVVKTTTKTTAATKSTSASKNSVKQAANKNSKTVKG